MPQGFGSEGLAIYLLGETREELSGSEWAHVLHGHLGGRPPAVDLGAERALAALLQAAAAGGVLAAAHDLSDGGLAQGLVESCLRRGVGATVRLPDGIDPCVALFAESTARAVVAVAADQQDRFRDLADEQRVPYAHLGVTDGAGQAAALEVEGLFSVPLVELRAGWSATIPAALS